MDDPFLVGRFERLRDLLGDRQCFVEGDGSLRDAISKRRPVDELHDEGRCPRRIIEAVNLGDVRMIQRREDLRFTLEAGEAVMVGGDVRRQHLNGHIAVQAAIAGAVHLPHAAAANERDDVVGAEASAGTEGQA